MATGGRRRWGTRVCGGRGRRRRGGLGRREGRVALSGGWG